MKVIFSISILFSLNLFAATLEIHPAFSAITVNTTDADTVYIYGACNAESRRNSIIVEAWKGSDISLPPYLDSGIDLKCNENEIDLRGACLVLEKDYSYSQDGINFEPICKNKKFAFKVKLGAPSYNNTYLVRVKIRTYSDTIEDSLRSSIVIQRQ